MKRFTLTCMLLVSVFCISSAFSEDRKGKSETTADECDCKTCTYSKCTCDDDCNSCRGCDSDECRSCVRHCEDEDHCREYCRHCEDGDYYCTRRHCCEDREDYREHRRRYDNKRTYRNHRHHNRAYRNGGCCGR